MTTLEHLELYDNKLKEIDGVKNMTRLTVLDLSYNRIKRIPPEQLHPLTNLTTLYVARNKLRKLDGLDTLHSLTKLDGTCPLHSCIVNHHHYVGPWT